ncbi:MAG: hypothetical protein WC607_00930, partial [Candidatus Micrarchaeia archaeon]
MPTPRPYSIRLNGHEVPVMHFTEERLLRALHGLGNEFRPTLAEVLEKGGFTLPFGRSSSGKLNDPSQMLSFRHGSTAVYEVSGYPPDAFLLTREGIKGYEVKSSVPRFPGKYRALIGLFSAARSLESQSRAKLVSRLNKALREGSLHSSKLMNWYAQTYQESTHSGTTIDYFVDDAQQIKSQLKKPHSFKLLSLTPLTASLHENKNAEGEPGA